MIMSKPKNESDDLENKIKFMQKSGFKADDEIKTISKHGWVFSYFFIKKSTWDFIFDMIYVLGDKANRNPIVKHQTKKINRLVNKKRDQENDKRIK